MAAQAPIQIGFIGVGNYGGALLEGFLLAASSGDSTPIDQFYIYDIDSAKTQGYKERYPHLVTITTGLGDSMERCDFHVIGVTSSQLSSLLEEIDRLLEVQTSAHHEFLFMDGSVHLSEPGSKAGFRYGRLMFTPWVRYGRGIVGFWPGTLSLNRVSTLKLLLATLGERWDVDSPAFLQRIRATAGCGIGVMGIILKTMRESFVNLGLSAEQANQSIASLIHGLDQHLIQGEAIDELAESVCSRENSLLRIMLGNEHNVGLQREIKNMFAVLKPHVSDAT